MKSIEQFKEEIGRLKKQLQVVTGQWGFSPKAPIAMFFLNQIETKKLLLKAAIYDESLKG